MSNIALIIGIILIFIAGLSAVLICRLLFKRSIVFNVFMALIVPIDTIAMLAFFVGARGIIHLAWAAPIAIAFLFCGYYLVSNMLRKPLDEMRDRVSSLSEGDVHISFDEKYQKGKHELAEVMRMLVKLTASLKGIVDFANHIGKGELNTEYTLLGDNDTLGKSMFDMRRNLQDAEIEKLKRQEEDERRNWITVGVAKFAELLRANNDNIEELCHSIVSNMVKYIGANQAGIFILNDEDPDHHVLELKACYAYERRKYLHKTIEQGEGLVGTCLLERQSIYMTHLPKDYIHITSGLGDEAPRALLIVPLLVNEEIYGVVEIAAFKEFEPHVREFVEKVAESIASTIGSVKVNIRTNQLLELSKVQSEEMAGQEEELRQNMEEMQATQEEMRRRELELSNTLERMKALQQQSEEKEFETKMLYQSILKTFPTIEFSTDGILKSIDHGVLKILGDLPEAAYLGHAFAKVYHGGEAEGKAIWNRLVSGEHATSFTKLNHTPVKIEYLPVFDKSNILQRVIALVITLDDDTAQVE